MRSSLVWCSFVVIAVLQACASPLPPAPSTVSDPSFRYVIGPGDRLEINTWQFPEASTKVEVGPDGMLSMPLVDKVQAAGREPAQLAEDLQAKLSRYLRDPKVTVMVTQFVGSPESQVRVVGQVMKPTSIAYRQGLTLLDAMIASGGLTDFAAGNRAVLIRAAENGKRYSLRLEDLMKGGEVTANVPLLPGDVITIPQSNF